MYSHEDESPPTVRFPEEIWQNVASRLSLRDWARASGACRTTWNLQLVNVAVTDHVTDHVNVGVSGEEQLRTPAGWVVARTLMAAQNTPSHVSQLVLELGQLQEDEGHATGTQLLSYFAAAAKRLRSQLARTSARRAFLAAQRRAASQWVGRIRALPCLADSAASAAHLPVECILDETWTATGAAAIKYTH
ncbi:hypothetical protein COCSUDRAFT_56208 [Coccomyxa subellipsoidea C-169]|uniref:F-box domain-containing protein n=1 Tax=Coccomyxa subellipsoidea (strain C-169) TaxID=574566 RepID=I0YTP3_COCSC|nr:hypothetical protein COCSUDRAFT_56208 [Coccomyxa subellipsoidea C-169]EIE21762.1 hypothetical protein COCSUDRAFT_56208 [Coccomyxa subellipsoidea C-169]|eukprot:XP_005646306.1 hypothetical protein COCSUDRAFT_56208 [Coccomyxa subellipsoidea C-169]